MLRLFEIKGRATNKWCIDEGNIELEGDKCARVVGERVMEKE